MRWVRAWLEFDGVGYRWFAQGMRGGNASSFDAVPAMSNIVSPVMPRVDRVNAPLDMELQGWERDFHSARIACTQAQTRWFIAQGESVNEYVIPEVQDHSAQ
ncbi:MAG: hypothetical protein HUU29_11315 [Planctomycetaceae bacterium]|nr:hypothetical protein [Planctomycetaceae bacterium]